MPRLRLIHRPKRPDSAALARPRKVAVTHGGSSALRHVELDLRTRAGKAWRENCEALKAHIGGDPSVAQAALIDQAARLRLLSQIAWAEIERRGAFKGGQVQPAVDAYRRAIADEREVLRLLGLERRVKPVGSLEDYLKGGAHG